MYTTQTYAGDAYFVVTQSGTYAAAAVADDNAHPSTHLFASSTCSVAAVADDDAHP